jgi:hypothetical protein
MADLIQVTAIMDILTLNPHYGDMRLVREREKILERRAEKDKKIDEEVFGKRKHPQQNVQPLVVKKNDQGAA